MKKTSLIIAAAAAIAFASCSNIPDKPVTDELTAEEVKKAVQSDSLFADLYDFARFRSSFMQSAEIARFSGLTYRNALEYIHFTDDSAFWDKQREQMTAEWNAENAKALQKTDSVIESWRDSISATHISDYIRITPVAANEKPTYFLYASTYRKMALTFEVEALKPIDELIFSYGFINNKAKDNFDFVATEKMTGDFREKRRIEGRNFVTTEYPLPDLDEFQTRLGLFILPETVVSGNDTVSINTAGIPINILKCLCINKVKFPAAYEKHRARAMQELFPDYAISENKYVKERIKDMKKAKDSLAYEFFLMDLE